MSDFSCFLEKDILEQFLTDIMLLTDNCDSGQNKNQEPGQYNHAKKS